MTLQDRMKSPQIIVAPGVYDALSAKFAADAGFEALYVSGASLSYTQLGQPDVGLTTLTEVATQVQRIAERVETPLIVDADTGFGNAVNTQRTMRMLEAAGASAVQLEDQTFPKRCGHLKGKDVVPVAEMQGKIRAACDARKSESTLVIARTDALAVHGMAEATARAHAYMDAGADILFVEAPRNLTQLRDIAAALAGTRPLLANMVEGGDTPILDAGTLQQTGFSLAIFPGALVRAFAHTARAFFQSLKMHGTTEPFMDRMVDFPELNRLLGTHDMLATADKYKA
jgi:2-methylisocitrate lyase-like PEP mutase family enzyme